MVHSALSFVGCTPGECVVLSIQVNLGLMGKVLTKCKWFQKLPSAMLGRISSVCVTMYCAPGDVLFIESDRAQDMFFVVKVSYYLFNVLLLTGHLFAVNK
jgi:hypothetical protein